MKNPSAVSLHWDSKRQDVHATPVYPDCCDLISLMKPYSLSQRSESASPDWWDFVLANDSTSDYRVEIVYCNRLANSELNLPEAKVVRDY